MLLGAEGLQLLEHQLADAAQPLHLGGQLVVQLSRLRDGGQVDALRIVGQLGQVAPDLLRGEGEDRRHHRGQGPGQAVDHHLGGAAGRALGRLAVHAVLDHIQVEAGQVRGAELDEVLEHQVELVPFVRLAASRQHPVQAVQGPAVQQVRVVRLWVLAVRRVAAQVAHEEAHRVAQLAVRLAQLAQDRLGEGHVVAVVHVGGPEAEQLRAPGLDHLLGRDEVLKTLGVRLALLVDHEAVGQHRPVRRLVPASHAGEHGRVEPAAVLVAALQVEVHGPEAVLALAHRGPAHARLEPHVDDVRLLAEVGGSAGAGHALGQQLSGVPGVPGVGALLGEDAGHMVDELAAGQGLVAILAVEHRDRHAPGALA